MRDSTKNTAKTKQAFTHIDMQGKARMVDVGAKHSSKRSALAAARIVFPPTVFQQLQAQNMHSGKGAILDSAQIAGIMAAKKTSDLIPMCHPLPIESCALSFTIDASSCSIDISAEVKITHKTGVEMEALTAVSIAALTIYDMCKALSHDIRIEHVRLLAKSGGKKDIVLTGSSA